MYIEKLTKKDFEKFAKIFDCTVAEIQMDGKQIYLQLFNGAMGPQPEMWISDFDLKTSEYYTEYEKMLKKKYIYLMRDKFGDEYQKDYTKDYNQKTDEGRII